MSDRALIIAAFIIGGAIVASSYPRPRFAISAADSKVAWRMDTWSGQIDICAAAYVRNGPIVRCGAVIVQPTLGPQPPEAEPPAEPAAPETPPAFTPPPRTPQDHA